MSLEIETTVFCENNISPRWLWWVRGIDAKGRFGQFATNEYGQGLYRLETKGDGLPERVELLSADDFAIPLHADKQAANSILYQHLSTLGWKPHSVIAHK